MRPAEIQRFARRTRWRAGFHAGCSALAHAAVICATASLAWHLLAAGPPRGAVWAALAACSIISLVAAIWASRPARFTDAQATRILDQRAGLGGLAISTETVESPAWRERLDRRLQERADHVAPRVDWAPVLHRLAVAGAALALLFWLPNRAEPAGRTTHATARAQTIEALREDLDRLRAHQAVRPEIAEELDDTLQHLEERIAKDEAVEWRDLDAIDQRLDRERSRTTESIREALTKTEALDQAEDPERGLAEAIRSAAAAGIQPPQPDGASASPPPPESAPDMPSGLAKWLAEALTQIDPEVVANLTKEYGETGLRVAAQLAETFGNQNEPSAGPTGETNPSQGRRPERIDPMALRAIAGSLAELEPETLVDLAGKAAKAVEAVAPELLERFDPFDPSNAGQRGDPQGRPRPGDRSEWMKHLGSLGELAGELSPETIGELTGLLQAAAKNEDVEALIRKGMAAFGRDRPGDPNGGKQPNPFVGQMAGALRESLVEHVARMTSADAIDPEQIGELAKMAARMARAADLGGTSRRRQPANSPPRASGAGAVTGAPSTAGGQPASDATGSVAGGSAGGSANGSVGAGAVGGALPRPGPGGTPPDPNRAAPTPTEAQTRANQPIDLRAVRGRGHRVPQGTAADRPPTGPLPNAAGEPEKKPKAGAADPATNNAPSGTADRRRVAPRHREAVRKFFDRTGRAGTNPAKTPPRVPPTDDRRK